MKHPNKEIDAAIRYAKSRGWTVKKLAVTLGEF